MRKAKERLVVRYHNLNRQRLLVVAAVLAVMAVFAAGYMMGAKVFLREMADKHQLENQRDKLKDRNTELEQQIINAELSLQIEREALEQTRKELVSLQQRLSDDEAELKLYRNLMQDDTLPSGLLVREMTLRSLSEGGVAYRLVVQQSKSSLRPINVRVNVVVEGEQDGAKKSYSLNELDESVSSMPLSMSFKYFDIKRGVLRLPAAFEPHVIKIEAWQKGSKGNKVTRTFGWRTERTQ